MTAHDAGGEGRGVSLLTAAYLVVAGPVGPIEGPGGVVAGSALLDLDEGRVWFFDAHGVPEWEHFTPGDGEFLPPWRVVDPAGTEIGSVDDGSIYVNGELAAVFRDESPFGRLDIFDSGGTRPVGQITLHPPRKHRIQLHLIEPLADDFRKIVLTLAYANWWWTD